jgi:hypothetical protein
MSSIEEIPIILSNEYGLSFLSYNALSKGAYLVCVCHL